MTGFTADQRDHVVARAWSLIGKPYVFGAAGPSSADCSGVNLYAWKPFIDLPHNSVEQLHWCAANGHVLGWNMDTIHGMLKGDLVFYYDVARPSHVAMYVGRNEHGDAMIVNAADEELGIQLIKIGQYAPPLRIGFVRH